MALEDLTGTKYLDDLVATNPVAGDNVSEGDDHIRGIKNVLKLSFPGVDAAVNTTAAELNLIDGGTARGTDALASGDGILINDAGTMKMTNVDTVQTFMQAGINTDLSNDSTPQLGGFLDANGNYMQTEKGADIASASPIVITTVGDYFDVTGTTGFAAMTVAADRQFTLQFDGVLTMTHHATNLDLPGEANITTAAGDVATFQSTGANTVQCINYTRASGAPIVPGTTAGTVVVRAVNSIPSGYLECNGAAISRTTYATLFAVLSTAYGTGNGSSTFNIPDLRGEFLRGWDNSKGTDSGRAIASAQGQMFETHKHAYNVRGSSSYLNQHLRVGDDGFSGSITPSGGSPSTGTYGSETRPRNIAMMYCIKY